VDDRTVEKLVDVLDRLGVARPGELPQWIFMQRREGRQTFPHIATD
jgi:hypothetical protein